MWRGFLCVVILLSVFFFFFFNFKFFFFFFFQAEDGIRDIGVTGVQTCALPIYQSFLRRNCDNMASIGLALTNVLLGIGSIGTGIGFGVAEQNKMDELNRKSKKLKEDVATASDLYDHVYYMVSVNLERVKKSLDKLPSDMLEKLQKEVAADMPESDTEKAIQTLAKVLGYAGSAAGLGAGLLQIVRYFRNRKAKGEEPSEPPEDPPFEEVPRDGVEPPPTIETETTFTKTPMMTRLINGLNIAGIVFGVAGLATTIGLGVWTLEKLRSEEHTSELQSRQYLVCRLLLEKKKKTNNKNKTKEIEIQYN